MLPDNGISWFAAWDFHAVPLAMIDQTLLNGKWID